MNWYILDKNDTVVNFVVWDGLTPVDFGGTPISEEDYTKQHPESFQDDEDMTGNN